LIYPLKIVIFHIYVCLPEGTTSIAFVDSTPDGPGFIFGMIGYSHDPFWQSPTSNNQQGMNQIDRSLGGFRPLTLYGLKSL